MYSHGRVSGPARIAAFSGCGIYSEPSLSENFHREYVQSCLCNALPRLISAEVAASVKKSHEYRGLDVVFYPLDKLLAFEVVQAQRPENDVEIVGPIYR